MPYTITPYTRARAKALNVTVRLSTNPKKKLDVYRGSKRVASVGALGYSDYPTFMKTRGIAYAKKRRSLYDQRHEKDMHRKGSPGWFAKKLLW